MRRGHMGGVGGVLAADITSDMGGDPLAAMEELDGGGGPAGIDELVDEGVGDGVVVPVQLDVIVDVDAGPELPVARDEGLGRPRAERRAIQAFEEFAPAGAVEAHRAHVQALEQLGDARVERGEREEPLVTEAGEDPPRRD